MGTLNLSVVGTLALTLVASGEARTVGNPTVATDCVDYSPGSTAYLSGAGFQPGETVCLRVLQINVSDNDGPEHQPWNVTANDQGAFAVPWPVSSHEAGATLWLSAKGIPSGLTAETIFADSALTPATGGAAIPAETAGGSYTPLTGPVLTETVVGDISLGTIVLTAPVGFVFDATLPLPLISLNGDLNNKNINGLANGAIINPSVTSTTIAFTVTSKSKGQTKNTLTYSNIRVRPTAATPLASGNISNTGTSIFPNSTGNYGTLTEVAGALSRLAVSGFPTPQTAGVPGTLTVSAQDQFGNTVPGYAGTVHFTCSDAQAILPADYTFTSGDNGAHTFSGSAVLKTTGAQWISVADAAASLSATQLDIVIIPGTTPHLAFVTQPGSATYGSLLSTYPVVVTQDEFGNNTSNGLSPREIVSLTLSSGTGQLLGTTSLDIGTAAGNGTVAFTNLTVNAAGSGKQLTAASATLGSAISSNFSIARATVTATVGVSNKVYDGTTGATVSVRSLAGVIGPDAVMLTGGTAAFDTKNAGTGKTAIVSGLSLGGASASNYVLASTTATATANITPAALTVTALASNKVYDGTTAAFATLYDDRLAGDVLTASYTAAAFADKNVSNSKVVDLSGISLSGIDAGNYTANTTAVASADITPASVTISAIDQSRAYGQSNPVFTVTYAGFVSGESASALTGVLEIGTSADTSSPVGSYAITPSGQSALNYIVQYAPGTLTISPAPLLVAANDATRSYGAANPDFTAVVSGLVNGDSIQTLSGGLALNTTAEASSPPGTYPIVPSGVVSTNYSITFSNGTLTITSTNNPPVLAAISNATVLPEHLLRLNLAASDLNGDRLSFTLDPGAPAGAIITNLVRRLPEPVTNTVFCWRPTRAQSCTTNVITIRVTDDGIPQSSVTQTFTVLVLDYLEIKIGSTNVQEGQTVAVPIQLASSTGVTNLSFTMQWPSGYLANPVLAAISPGVGSASLLNQGSNLLLTIQAFPGQAFQGTQQIAQVSFLALSNQYSAFVPLPIGDAVASDPAGASYSNYLLPTANIAVVAGQPLLYAFLSGDSARNLTLYGRIGVNYQLQSSTNVGVPEAWQPQWSYLQTNGAITIDVDSVDPTIFYRLYQP